MTNIRCEVPLAIHYPRSGEILDGEEYSFRVKSHLSAPVQISIDNGPWLPCRAAAGYWWLDWLCGSAGQHEVSARVQVGEGRFAVTDPRLFFVGRIAQRSLPDPEDPAPRVRTAAGSLRRWSRASLTALRIRGVNLLF